MEKKKLPCLKMAPQTFLVFNATRLYLLFHLNLCVNNILNPILPFLLLLFSFGTIQGQKDTFSFISSVVYIDSIFVTAKSDFNAEDFVEMVKNDSSFYQAFRNLRFANYSSTNNIQLFDKKKNVIASYQSISKQKAEGNCRKMSYHNEEVTGNYYKKDRVRYYTGKLYNRVFFTFGRKCEKSRYDHNKFNKEGEDKTGSRIAELKRFIFSPGQRVDVPIVGKRTAIFEEHMVPYYDYEIESKTYLDLHDCYVFKVKAKPEYLSSKNGKTIVKSLETYFDKETFQVIARNYTLAYFGVFDFDVTMQVEVDKIGDYYLPIWIRYDGFFKVPTQKRETATFESRFTYE